MAKKSTNYLLPKLLTRKPNSHKGDYGHALLIGGSPAMAGAISLASMATLRGGAGLVTVAVPEGIQATVAQFDPSYMTVGLEMDLAGQIPFHKRDALVALAKSKSCIGIGPGMGSSKGIEMLVSDLYTQLRQPMVIDADALNAISQRTEPLAGAARPPILTPHPGEFRRLTKGRYLPKGSWSRIAAEMAQAHKAIIVLKGHRTVVTDGQQIYTNNTGNAGMATGGCGDVLTGLITALVARGYTPMDAACLGVYLHGLAGDLAVKNTGKESLIASDLIDFIESAFQSAEKNK
ncbi:MAG: NAD(P)H-hydrate dehydratase [Pirellulales bacterium]